jgi:hypothetical protein
MDYANLDELLERANKYEQMSSDIFDAKEEELQRIEFSITHDPSLLKILKISKILKNANFKNFDLIKNLDPTFKCDGENLIIKFENSPIELRLYYSSVADTYCVMGLDGLNEDYVDDLYKFYNKVIDNIENYKNAFIEKINRIFKKQDADYSEIFPE